jgi:hypothetical protein
MLSETAVPILGQQRPRFLHLPSSAQKVRQGGREVVNSLGSEVVDLSATAGLELDDWQCFLLEHACSLRDEEFWNPYTYRVEKKWAAFEFGLVVARQNGKTALCVARMAAGLFLFGERLIIYSAHQFDTSLEAFDALVDLIDKNPSMKREIARGGVSRSHGKEGIELKNGQRVRFRTRTKGGGRGFTCDFLILDEAMYLDTLSVRATLPTLSARPNPQVWYCGSPGDKQALQFGAVRARGVSGIPDPDLLFAEWSADLCNPYCPPDCDEHDKPGDPRTWAKANPSLGIRLQERTVAAEYRSIGTVDPEGFAMERLGVGDWPVVGDGWLVIPKDRWEDQAVPATSEITGQFVLAVDTAPDRTMSCIAACGLNQDEKVQVEITGRELYDHKPGIQWLVPRIREIWEAQRPYAVVIDKASPAGTLIDQLESLGIEVISPATRDFAQACGDFVTGVSPRRGEDADIVHIDQPQLNVAVASAERRQLMDLWAWSKKDSAADISPLVAVTLAAWGYKKYLYQKVSTPWVFRR